MQEIEIIQYKIVRVGRTSGGADKEVNELATQGYQIVSTAAAGTNGEFLWVTMGRKEKRQFGGGGVPAVSGGPGL